MNSRERDSKTASPVNILSRRIFPSIGVTGLAITVAMNLVALYVFKKVSAEFFSTGWWSSWFSCYAVWVTFVIIGLAGIFMKRD
jgi:hypothetical protein